MSGSKVVIQGYEGSFHHEAAMEFFNGSKVEIVPCQSFEELAMYLTTNHDVDTGIIAIENSIAGSLLQNYRILRENHFWISGEVYLRIEHNLMALPNQNIRDIYELRSHPMAINQCLNFLKQYPHIRLVESVDTALSAREIAQQNLLGIGAIGSSLAAKLYNLEILNKGIETSKVNYTRFFVVERRRVRKLNFEANKASIFLRVRHEKGSLLEALQKIYSHDINMSKLQSYPVPGKFSQYYFHIDLEFLHIDQYNALIQDLLEVTEEIEELGVYKRSSIHQNTIVELKS